MKLEKFEQEYLDEIETIRTAQFAPVVNRGFKFPSYRFVYRKAYAVAFAMPALVFIFALFFYTGQNSPDNHLTILEDSNTRILQAINALDE